MNGYERQPTTSDPSTKLFLLLSTGVPFANLKTHLRPPDV